MANLLTDTTNPYSSYVESSAQSLADYESQMSQVNDAIKKLESLWTSAYSQSILSQLYARRDDLQKKIDESKSTNKSATDLMNSFDKWLYDTTTLEWIYQMKQAQIAKAKAENDEMYRRMYERQKEAWDNYINALQNATASENAIINANAGRAWASMQSTAEARAMNYLNQAKQWNEAYANLASNLNAIDEARLATMNNYNQLWLSDADNYLRQQVMNDYNERLQQQSQAAAARSWSWWWWSSSSGSRVTLPKTWTDNKIWDVTSPDWTVTDSNWNVISPDWTVLNSTPTNNITDESKDQYAKLQAWDYWLLTWDVSTYTPWSNSVTSNPTVWSMAFWWQGMWEYITWQKWVWYNKDALISQLDWLNTDWYDQWSYTVQKTDKWYLVFTDKFWNTRIVDSKDLIK